jgi:uncharacterized protein
VLLIDLTLADSEPFEFSERFMLTANVGDESISSIGPVTFAGAIEKSSRGYCLNGVVGGEVKLVCARCLSEYEFSFEDRIEVQLQQMVQQPEGDEARLGRDDLDVRFFVEPQIDLCELAGEQLQLSLPMKPLCKPTCCGLCSRCGANLNEGACPCPEEVDSRLEALGDWRQSN